MSEIKDQTNLVPEMEKSIEESPPFQVGDLVQMRAKALQLTRFWNYEKGDVGIVLEVKKGKSEWIVNVHWQKFIPKNGKSIVKHSRLKKVRFKKDVSQKD